MTAPGAIDAPDSSADHGGTAEGRGSQLARAKMAATIRKEKINSICTGFFAASAGQRPKFESPVRVRWACSAVASACAVSMALFTPTPDLARAAAEEAPCVRCATRHEAIGPGKNSRAARGDALGV
jgi:hypothetical protein